MHINQLMYYNCYEIMCINKYRLWDYTQKITWFHILARNTIFLFSLLPGHQPHLANRRWSCLAVQALAWRCSGKRLYHRFTAWFDVPSTPTIPSSSFVVRRCRRLLCNYHLIFLTRLSLTLESAR